MSGSGFLSLERADSGVRTVGIRIRFLSEGAVIPVSEPNWSGSATHCCRQPKQSVIAVLKFGLCCPIKLPELRLLMYICFQE